MILIKNATICTMDTPPINSGAILTDDSKIAKIFSARDQLPAPDQHTTILDAKGGWVLPGLIDAHCHIGITEDSIGKIGQNCNEHTNPITPALSAADAVNPMDPAFKDAIRAGITSVMTGPGSSNIVGGQFIHIKTSGTVIDDMLIKAPAAMKVAFGENPKTNFGEKDKSPVTRMAIASMLREELMRAVCYRDDKAEHAKENAYFRADPHYESWLPVLEGKIPLKAHAHRADDILTAIRIAKEFDLQLTLDHCSEGHLIPERLGAEGFPAIIGPALQGRSKYELRELSLKTPAVLEQHGIEFALMTDHPVCPIYMLPIYAGISVREGLSLEGALKSITVNAAKICGSDSRVGRLKKGMDADIAVYDGNPLETFTKTLYTIIDGKIVYSRDKECK